MQADHRCFACGPANPAGLQMKFYADKDSVVSWLSVPDHLRGWSQLVHGGIISTILDEIMSWAAIHLLNSIILTRSMTVDFKKTILVGQPLKAVGRVLELRDEREAIMEGVIFSESEAVCARSAGTFALLKPKVALKLGIVDEKELEQMLPKTST